MAKSAPSCVRESGGECRFAMAGNPPCFAGPGETCVETSAEAARERLVAAALAAHRDRRASRWTVGCPSKPQRHTNSGRPKRTAKDYRDRDRAKLRALREQAGRI